VLRRGKETNGKDSAKKAWKLFIDQNSATRDVRSRKVFELKKKA